MFSPTLTIVIIMMPPPSLSSLSLGVAYAPPPHTSKCTSLPSQAGYVCTLFHTTVYVAKRIGTLPYTPAEMTPPPSGLKIIHKEGSDQYSPIYVFYSIDNYYIKVYQISKRPSLTVSRSPITKMRPVWFSFNSGMEQQNTPTTLH